MNPISFRCSEEENEQLEERARLEGVDKTKIIIKACRLYLQSESKKQNPVQIPMICDLNTLINKLDKKIIKKKKFIKEIREVLRKWHI